MSPMVRSKLHLPMVTVCVADCSHYRLAARALSLTIQECVFGDAILFTDRVVDGPFRVELIASLNSKDDYSAFIMQKLYSYIRTPFVLIIQWDGYVTDINSWSEQFLDYDYIGAVWPHHVDRRIGNGGFSLRSLRLLKATASLFDSLVDKGIAEDVAICRCLVDELEKDYGLRFAPELIADKFSYEYSVPDVPTFGFHGLFNMWRYLSDDEMIVLILELKSEIIGRYDYMKCMFDCFFYDRLLCSSALYQILRNKYSIEDIRHMMEWFSPSPALMDNFIHRSEAMAARQIAGIHLVASKGVSDLRP